MITKNDIRLAICIYYKGKNKYHMPIEQPLTVQEKYRKVLVYKNLIIDLKTSRRLYMLREHPYEKCNTCLCIVSLEDLSYITDDDLINALTALNNYLDDYKVKKESDGKILRIRPLK